MSIDIPFYIMGFDKVCWNNYSVCCIMIITVDSEDGFEIILWKILDWVQM